MKKVSIYTKSGQLEIRKFINKKVSDYGLTMEDISGKSRKRNIVEARRLVIKELNKIGYSSVEIALVLNKDHTSIIYHLQVT